MILAEDEFSPSQVEHDLNYDFISKFNNLDLDDFNFDNPFSNVEINSNYYDENEFCARYRNFSGLSLITWNIQSLNSKFDGFKEFISTLSEKNIIIDVFALQEVFNIENDNFFNIEGYDLFYKCRKNGKRGGVAIYCKKSLKGKVINDLCIFEENFFEGLTIEIGVNQKKKAVISNIYRPPINSNTELTLDQQLEKFIDIYGNFQSDISSYNHDSFILGDFNFDILKFHSHAKTNDFLECNFVNGFLPLISKPTRFSHTNASCIDNIYVNYVANNFESGIILNTSSDHFPCYHIANFSKCKEKPEFFYTRDFSQEKFEQFNEILSSHQWENVLSNENAQISFDKFMEFYMQSFETNFPLKRVKFNKNYHRIEPFMTKGLLISRQKKLKLASTYAKSRTALNTINYKRYRDIYNSLIKLAKKVYYKDMIQKNRSDLRKQWQVLREALRKTNDKTSIISEIKYEGLTFTGKKEITEKFNMHFTSIASKIKEKINPSPINPCDNLPDADTLFSLNHIYPQDIIDVVKKMEGKQSKDMFGISNSMLKKIVNCIALPLCHIFNKSFSSGIIPDQLKLAKVIPICKLRASDNGDKSLPTNYRPISLLPIFSKILEKLVANRLNDYLLENNIIYKHQYGFQAKKSTVHPIMHLINEIAMAKNNKQISIGVFCDISKGFDTLSHDILINKLNKIGVKNKELDWFRNYLYQRKQFVCIDEENSESLEITTGVPQGSVLGPLLFLIYINDLPNATELFTYLFADDSTFLISGKNLNEVITKLNSELKKINSWFRSNKLSLNTEKTKFMIFNKKEDSIVWEDINVYLDSNNASENNPELISKLSFINSQSQTPAIKFLGVFIDSNLNFKYHIEYVRKKVSNSIYMINRVKNILCTEALLSLYNSFVHSHFMYCLPIWSSCPKTYLEPLYKLQKRAIRIITGSKYNAHTEEKFKKLKILPLHQLAEYVKLLFMYDYINGKLPSSFIGVWKRNSEMYNAQRNNRRVDANHFYNPKINFKSIERLPIFHYSNLWNTNCFNDLLTSDQPRKMFIKNLKAYLMIQVETICTNARCTECANNSQ